MHKLHIRPPPDDGPAWIHLRTFRFERMGDSARITAGCPGGDAAIFHQVVACLAEPYLLLYVLHTPRGEQRAGRYESGELSAAEFAAFLMRFAGYLGGDSRFDLWVHAPEEDATIVWDRHDLVHAYGPLERVAGILGSLGFNEGEVDVPVPHIHHYRQEFDADAADLLASRTWSWGPLRPEDEQ